MKKRILFVQESLRLAGSEKSLITLLKNLDPGKYDMDLQLMSYGGELEKELPTYVRLLPEFRIKKLMKKNLLFSLPTSIFDKESRDLQRARWKYSMAIRKKDWKHSEKAQYFWEHFGRFFPVSEKVYDVAIGFAQGFPTFYVADKVKAEKKICWINANMKVNDAHRSFQERYYKQFSHVVCITQQNKEHTQGQLPSLNNLTVLENIIDYSDILRASQEKTLDLGHGRTNILTVGRLNNSSKGMDIAIEAARYLRDSNRPFHWYFLGEGPFRPEMEEFIRTHHLEGMVTLLGTDKNPYPYFAAADIYVQTSRHEGFGRTIAEARMLNVPVVSTRFDTVDQQIKDEVNGLITGLGGQEVAQAILRLMDSSELYERIRSNLMSEQKLNLDSVRKFDELIHS